MGIEDPDNPGTYLDMCGLFEKGIVNEVWGMVADPATVKFATSAETKQAYDDNGEPIAGQFVCTSNGPCIDQALPCKVSTRFYDFNPGRGSGCHLFDNGLVWEHYITAGALPAFAKVAAHLLQLRFRRAVRRPLRQLLPGVPDDDGHVHRLDLGGSRSLRAGLVDALRPLPDVGRLRQRQLSAQRHRGVHPDGRRDRR